MKKKNVIKKMFAVIMALSVIFSYSVVAMAEEGDTCLVCNETHTHTDICYQHQWDAGVVNKESTCTEPGTKTYTCQQCHLEKSETIPLKRHSFATRQAKLPTCTEPGQIEIFCSNCKTVLSTQPVPAALGHKVSETGSTEIEKGSCYKGPLLKGVCTRCKETVQAEGEPLGHSWDTGTVENGIRTYRCTREACDATSSIPVDEKSTDEIAVTVKIKYYEAVPFGSGSSYTYGDLLNEKIYTSYVKKNDNYRLDLSSFIPDTYRADLESMTGGYGTVGIIDSDTFNFEKQILSGNIGASDVDIVIKAKEWYNFTQISCYFEQPDGKWKLEKASDGSYVGRRHVRTTLNRPVEYVPDNPSEFPEGLKDYNYYSASIGYYHNQGSNSGPGTVKTVPLTRDEQEAWGLHTDSNGIITGMNINFFANKQLYINYFYSLPSFNLDYDLNGGNVDGNTEIPTEKVKRSKEVSVISNPARSGYTFTGWTITVDNDEVSIPVITDGKFTMPGANVTLKANWSYNPPYVPTTPTDPMGPTDPAEPPVEPDTPDTPEEPSVVDPSGDEDPIVEPSGDSDKADTEAKGVKTGDETMLAMWGALGLIAALGLGGALVIGRRREE